jgi:hypothetical protein
MKHAKRVRPELSKSAAGSHAQTAPERVEPFGPIPADAKVLAARRVLEEAIRHRSEKPWRAHAHAASGMAACIEYHPHLQTEAEALVRVAKGFETVSNYCQALSARAGGLGVGLEHWLWGELCGVSDNFEEFYSALCSLEHVLIDRPEYRELYEAAAGIIRAESALYKMEKWVEAQK